MRKLLFCEHCSICIKTETDIYFESDSDSVVYCEECGDEYLTYSDSINSYVYEYQYKDTYMDDEISDLDLYTKREPEGEIIMTKQEFMAKHDFNDLDFRNLIRYEEARKTGIMNMFDYLNLMQEFNINGGKRLARWIMAFENYKEFREVLENEIKKRISR